MSLISPNPETAQPTLILIDGHSLAFRSYYAFAKGRDGGLRTSTGIPTSVCFGFLKSLLEVMTVQKPEYIAVAFDLGLPTFRHEADDTYKANRKETPEDFIEDLKNLHELLEALNLRIITSPGYEADDVLATLAEKGSAAGFKVKIVSGDRDLFQLIDPAKAISVLYLDSTFWRRSGAAGPVEFSIDQVREKLGINPAQVVDYKALCGDSSDNIPGVKGIGDKTALQLLEKYGNLDNIYNSLEEIKGATRKKLEEGKESAYHSRYLAQLKFDAPLETTLENCQLQGFDSQALEELLQKLEFKTFLSKVKKLQATFGGKLEDSTDQTPLEIEDEDLWFFSAEDTQKAQEQDQNLPFEIQIIDTPEKLNQLVQKLITCTDPNSPVAWDTETTSLEPRDADLVGIGCCFGQDKDNVVYIPIGHSNGQNLDKNLVLDSLRPILETAEYPKVLQNAKYDRLVLRTHGIQLAGVIFDPMLAHYLLNPESSHNLIDLTAQYLADLNLRPKSYTDLVPKGKTIAEISIHAVAEYCEMDAYTTFLLGLRLRQELIKFAKLESLLKAVEQPLEPVLAEMEYTGIRIDCDYLNQLSEQLKEQLEAIETQAYKLAGEEFNMGSPKQVSQILLNQVPSFEKKARKTKTGYSTDAATLEKFTGEPVVDAILEYRTLDKLKSTYVDALPKLVRTDTQRVHTNFNQTATGTGRLSSSNPNLQNIPIRTEFSRQIRKAFLPESGWLLVSADYSQIELRILAHLSQEPVLVQAYQQNEDIHRVTAKLLFEKEQISSEERRWAKTINFGVIYGMGAQRFARETGLTSADGKKFIQRFYERYPKVFEYLELVQKQVISQGYVGTILGRRRYFQFEEASHLRSLQGKPLEEIDLNQIKGKNDAAILRAAANAPIQGSSADIIKIAMVKLHEILSHYQARLLLQVHDELVFEIPPQEWEELRLKIRDTMESALPLSVPLVVDINAGENWMKG